LEMPLLVTGLLAMPELLAEDHDQLPVGGRSIGIGLAQVAGGWHSLACQGGENGERLAGGEPAVEHLGRCLDDLFDHNTHTPTLGASPSCRIGGSTDRRNFVTTT
jgi:hypothetical protein